MIIIKINISENNKTCTTIPVRAISNVSMDVDIGDLFKVDITSYESEVGKGDDKDLTYTGLTKEDATRLFEGIINAITFGTPDGYKFIEIGGNY